MKIYCSRCWTQHQVDVFPFKCPTKDCGHVLREENIKSTKPEDIVLGRYVWEQRNEPMPFWIAS